MRLTCKAYRWIVTAHVGWLRKEIVSAEVVASEVRGARRAACKALQAKWPGEKITVIRLYKASQSPVDTHTKNC